MQLKVGAGQKLTPMIETVVPQPSHRINKKLISMIATMSTLKEQSSPKKPRAVQLQAPANKELYDGYSTCAGTVDHEAESIGLSIKRS